MCTSFSLENRLCKKTQTFDIFYSPKNMLYSQLPKLQVVLPPSFCKMYKCTSVWCNLHNYYCLYNLLSKPLFLTNYMSILKFCTFVFFYFSFHILPFFPLFSTVYMKKSSLWECIVNVWSGQFVWRKYEFAEVFTSVNHTLFPPWDSYQLARTDSLWP